jgi:integrase
MMQFVFKPRRMVKGKRRVARTFTGQYRIPGDAKTVRVPLGVSDKQVAEEMLRRIVKEAEQEREGLLRPKDQRDAAKQPISKQIDEFVGSRRGLGRDEKYVCELRRKLLRLAGECGWKTVRDVNGYSFEKWRARQPLSAKTRNEYHNALTVFCNWVEPRTGTNPMRFIQKVEERGTRKWFRRSLTLAEFRRLIMASGDRGVIYLVAGTTGLRRGELEGIQWRDVCLAGRPYIAVRASIAKNHQNATQPLTPEAAEGLRRLRPTDWQPNERVFCRIPRMDRFRLDLQAAGIPYVDEKGERADFHALRTTFGTLLMLAGVPEIVRMKLMRHSDMRLTQQVYTDGSMVPIWDAVAGLPVITDAQIDALKLVNRSQTESVSVQLKAGKPDFLTSGEQTFSPSESTSVTQSPQDEEHARCRVRTCDFLRVKQALYH